MYVCVYVCMYGKTKKDRKDEKKKRRRRGEEKNRREEMKLGKVGMIEVIKSVKVGGVVAAYGLCVI